MKITVEVVPQSDHLKAVSVLMNRAAFKEIGRVVTGGYMSPVMLAISYEGSDHTFNMLKNSIYTVIPEPNMILKKLFYSLTCLNGHSCETEEQFLSYLEGQIMNNPEIKYFNK